MTTDVTHLYALKEYYVDALRNYLSGSGEGALMRAYEFGRTALREGFGVLDVVSLHNDAMNIVVSPLTDPVQIRRTLESGQTLLEESLSPYETAYRGFREANTRLEEVLPALNTRTAELAGALREKDAAESLHRSDEQLRLLVEATQAALFRLDRTGRITYINGEGARTLGFTPDELIGKSYLQFVHPEDRQRIDSGVRQRVTVTSQMVPVECRFRGNREKNGWMMLFANPILERGERTGFTGIALNTTGLKQAEELLHQLYSASERQAAELWALVESMPEAVFIGTTEGITLCNTNALQMIGEPALEDIQVPIGGLLRRVNARWPATGRPLKDDESQFYRALRGEKVVEEILITNVKTGKDICVRSACAPIIRDEKVIGAVAIISDITDRKLAENARSHLAAIVESSDDAIFSKSLDGIILTWNRGAQKLYGYSAADVVGKHVSMLLPEHQQDEMEALLRQVRAGVQVNQFETQRRRRDGTILHVLLSISPIRDEQGNVIAASTIAHDITGRKQAQIAVQRIEAILNQAAQMAHFGAWEIDIGNPDDLNSNPLWWSDEVYRIFGYEPGSVEVTNDFFFAHVHPDDRHLIAEAVEQALAEHGSYAVEHRIVRPDGSERTVLERSEIIFDQNGRPRRMIGAVLDITERKLAEEAVQKVNSNLERLVSDRTAHLDVAIKELEAFSYSVSHDLRAPLRAIHGFSQMLASEYKQRLDEQGAHYVDVIHTSTHRMGELIDDLLAFSRFARVPIEKTAIDMNRLVRSVIAELKRDEESRPASFTIASLPPAWGSAAMIRQVYMNLISNALKYTKTKPESLVEIGSEPGDKETIYYVKDNGIGFNMKYAEKLFNVFQRLHKLEQFEGTGIGLAIVKRVILRHGGRVWAHASVDVGATFYFALPQKGSGE